MKLQNGAGSIVKLGGNRRKPWAVRVTDGWKDNKQVRKYIGYYSDQSEALIALAEYHKNGVMVDLTKLTLLDVYDKWIQRVEKKASASVLSTHKMTRDRLGSLGKSKIKTVKVDHLQDWLDGIDLKPSTKGKLKSTLTQMYDYAVQNDIVSKNYAKHLEIDGKVEKTGAIFTMSEISKLWQESHREEIQNILILIYTGLRIGELLAIHKDNVNLEERYMIGGSKTEAGRNRVIPIHKAILPFIQARLEKQDYMIVNKKGDKPAIYRTVQYRFDKMMDEFGWSHKIHDTRKTAVSIMHGSGIPMETIRIIVGHSGKGVTEAVYLYKEPRELVNAIDMVDIEKSVTCMWATYADTSERK